MARTRRLGALLAMALLLVPLIILTVGVAGLWAKNDGGMSAAPPTAVAGRDWESERASRLGIQLAYPDGWVVEEGPPLIVRPGSGDKNAMMVVSDGDAPLPAPLNEALVAATVPIRTAQNVAVGTLSGTETTYVTPAASAALANRAEGRTHPADLVVVVWEATDHPARIYLVAEEQGDTLDVLAQIRSTLHWER